MSIGKRNSEAHVTIPMLCGCTFLFIAHTAFAETLVDPNVESVVEGGRWREDRVGEGTYRVIVLKQGFEHISSRVVAEWKSEADESGDARIIHSADLVKGGFYSIGVPKVAFSKEGARIQLEGTATYAPNATVVCRFDLSPGGKVTVIRACGD